MQVTDEMVEKAKASLSHIRYGLSDTELRGALTAALSGQQAVEARIKPLEWDKTLGTYRGSERRDQWRAKTPWGDFVIWHYQMIDDEAKRGPKFTVGSHMTPFPVMDVEFDTLQAAKAAAQADYEQRIRSALSVSAENVASSPSDGRMDRSVVIGDADDAENSCDLSRSVGVEAHSDDGRQDDSCVRTTSHSHVSRDEEPVASALVDVPAVEPVAKQWCAYEDGQQRTSWQPDGYGDRAGWEALAKRNPAKYQVVTRDLSTSPPLSREGEDAKAEQYWSTVEQLANCEDEISRLRALLSRAEEYVIDGVTNAKAEAEMNAPYPARAPRYDAALAEVRQLYADIQAAIAATRSGYAPTSRNALDKERG